MKSISGYNPPQADSFSAPGKVFLVGEYGVLCGLPAIVFAVAPRFTFTKSTHSDFLSRRVSSLSPFSPAGALFQTLSSEQQEKLITCFFNDPYFGQGGFGGSTAEFGFIACASGKMSPRPESALLLWKTYQEIHRNSVSSQAGSSAVLPSGADLVTQWVGGFLKVAVTEDRSEIDWACISPELIAELKSVSRLAVFSAAHQSGRKVATHTHLEKLNALIRTGEIRKNTERSVFAAIEALMRGGLAVAALGEQLISFAESLQGLGLELDLTTEDRKSFLGLPGVLGCKGTGAMQADSILVLMDKSRRNASEEWEACLKLAQKRDLRLVVEDWPNETGIVSELS